MNAENAEKCRAGNTVPPGKKRKISIENAENAENAEVEGGAGGKLPSKTKSNAFHWVFTWANYPENWKDFFNDRKSLIEKICVGEEVCPTTGTKHLQGWIRLFKKNIPMTYLGLPKQIHWEIMSRNATEKQNTIYCTKARSNTLTWGIPSPWKREITEMKPWMTELMSILSTPLEEGNAFRTIYWIWEPEGNTGKTVFQQAMYHTLEGVVAIEGKAADVKHFVCEYTKKTGTTPKIIFVNIPRVDLEFVSYGAIEKVKDMFFMSGKYEGGMVSGPRPHVMIFANDGPIRRNMSEDRWKIARIVGDTLEWV